MDHIGSYGEIEGYVGLYRAIWGLYTVILGKP